MKSYWDTVFDETYDYIIIGSGIVGLNAAIELKSLDVTLKILILERGRTPQGASTKNAGFACFGSPSEILADLKDNTEDQIISLIRKRYTGLKNLREIVGDKNMDYQNIVAFELFSNPVLYEKCIENMAILNDIVNRAIGFRPFLVSESFNVALKAIKILGEGQIHPGKMVKTLMNKAASLGVDLRYNVEVTDLGTKEDDQLVYVGSQVLFTKNIIICSNGFVDELMPLGVLPARNQVILTEQINNLKIRGNYHMDEGFIYFRNVEDRLLIGGARNIALDKEQTSEFGLTPEIQERLESILFEILGRSVKIEHRWSGILGIGNSKVPIVKKLKNGVFCAVKLSGMGIAIGTALGQEVANLAYQKNRNE